MKTFKQLVAGMIFLAMLVVPSQTAWAAEAEFTASLAADNPLKPVLTLKNETDKSCQVANTSHGTIAITEVRQNGKALEPLALESSASDSLELYLPKQLKTLEPGQSVDIPLDVHPLQGGHSLEAVTWSYVTGPIRSIYKIAADQPLQLAVTYDTPISVSEGAPLCGMALASNFGATSNKGQVITVAAAVPVIVAIIIWIIKNRSRFKKLWPKLFVIVFAASMLPAGSVNAEYNVPPEIQSSWDYCMGIFRENRDITGPVLDAMDAAGTVEVVHVTWDGPGANDSSGSRELSYYRIYWNPDSSYAHYDGVRSDGCAALFHEMYHNYEVSQGTLDTGPCGTSGISIKEVNATRAENRLRDRLGLPLRTTYGSNTLPEGDCTAPPPPASCTSGSCADSNGDPHLVTFDGLRYDFQAVGEFVAVSDKSGEYEVQVRQEPWPKSRVVSLNTAVAMKVGKDKVELRQLERKLRIWVNGKEQAFKAAELAGGGSILPAHDQQGAVVWPDGASVTVRTIGAYGLHIIIDPPSDKKGNLEGIFGNFDGNKDDDLRIRGTGNAIKPDHDALYPKFADSWRISNTASLFTYEKGVNTETFTDRSFPDEKVTASDLPNRAAAERICRSQGVTDAQVLENCILDVALTGRPEFAHALHTTQTLTKGTDYGGTVYPIEIKKPGDTAAISFDAKAGQRIFADVFGTTFPDRCGVLHLDDPAGRQLSSGCIINGRGLIDGTTLPVDGKYTITLGPADNLTGIAKLRLIFITDKTAPITPDGDVQSTVIDKPGVVASFSFTGKAGQRIFVHFPAATLPDQCGGLYLKGPGDKQLNSGCIINGEGYIDTTVLPDTGTYTVVVDPSERGTGRVAVKVTLPTEHTANLSLNGSAAKLTFSKPGDSAVWRFKGIAGQRVYVEITNSTLNQCGGITLHDPAGKNLGSGCIINGEGDIGNEGTVLPATGDYTITIDPSRWTTAQATVRVRN